MSVRGTALLVEGEWAAVSDAIRTCYQVFNGDGIVGIETALRPVAHAEEGAAEGRPELRTPGSDGHWAAGRSRRRKDTATARSVA